MKKPIYVLGINESHIATAALLKDGEIISCASEERFTRKKGQWGYPKLSVAYCLKEAGIDAKDLQAVYLGFLSPIIATNDETNRGIIALEVFKFLSSNLSRPVVYTVGRLPFTYNLYKFAGKVLHKLLSWGNLEAKNIDYLAKELNV